MNNIIISKIINENEIDILLDKESIFDNFSYKYNEEIIDFLKKNLNNKDSLYLIAKQDNNFVAFISIDDEWWEEDSFFIREIFVNPLYQKQKI
jgi:predicted N-acetyltransferase YhbS